MSNSASFKAGLQDVVALTSDICFIDGDEGRLLYRGYNIDDLVKHSTFEEVAFLLWHGRLPSAKELADLKSRLGSLREVPAPLLQSLRAIPGTARPMEVLRTAVSSLSHYDPTADDTENALDKAERLLAQMPTIVAAWHRIRNGKAPIAPQADLSLATDFLRMLSGELPDPEIAKVFDACLILHADHELNASTFAARVAAATLSDLYSSVTAAIGTLKGPLHGGANEQVMAMLLDIGSVEAAEDWVMNALANKQRIMGFGHRVYRNGDPRAAFLRQYSEALGKRMNNTKYFEISDRVQAVVGREKPGLYPNVDFYSASVYYVMGIPTDLFTPIFAMSRTSGWTAHVLEQYRNNRLIRPRAEYTGPLRMEWVDISAR